MVLSVPETMGDQLTRLPLNYHYFSGENLEEQEHLYIFECLDLGPSEDCLFHRVMPIRVRYELELFHDRNLFKVFVRYFYS